MLRNLAELYMSLAAFKKDQLDLSPDVIMPTLCQ